ncbi:MAG: hypothetical protein CL678_09600 [Bdellovibrionaceae bacterium]|nr:hypothetical protein [Pseudobdellovibrionaceae bacterium]
MSNGKCEKNVCTCQNGTSVDSGVACSTHGANICKICKLGYTLKNNACVPNTCICQNGTPVPSGDPNCKKDGDNVCKSCKFRHSLKNLSCIEDPWTIEEGKKCVRQNFVAKKPQKCDWTNWSDMYSKCRLPEAGLVGNDIINKVKEKYPNCNWSSNTSKVTAPINYSYMFDSCCRGPGATSWELVADDTNVRDCAMQCDIDKDCNAIEINGCLDNEPNCKGKCYHFKGENDGEITYGGCIDTGDQKCFKKTSHYKITVAEAETITKKESIPPDPLLPTHGPCPLGCTPPWKSEGNCKIVEKNGDIWRECPYKCSTPFGKGCKYDRDCTKEMCGAFYCPTVNGSKCAHVGGEHGKAWSDAADNITVTEKPKADKIITNVGEFAAILGNKNLIPKDIILNSENQQDFVRIGKSFVSEFSKTKHVAIPQTSENLYEHIGRMVSKMLGGKISEFSMKSYSKRLKLAVKNILSKTKLSRSKIKTDTVPKMSATSRTTNMMNENANALMAQYNRDGPGRGTGGLIGNYTDSYKPVSDQTAPISNDLVYTFY